MILSESPLSQRAAQESLPLRDAFAVLFFVSVGMLFDPASLVRELWPLLAALFIIIVGKSVAAFLIVARGRHGLILLAAGQYVPRRSIMAGTKQRNHGALGDCRRCPEMTLGVVIVLVRSRMN